MRTLPVAAMAAAACLAGTALVPAAEPEAPPLEQAVQAMLSERDSKDALEAAIKKARELGATRQAALEARFLFHVDRREHDELAAMLPELVEQNKEFDLAQSEIFAVEEDWLAIIEYARALDALRRDDEAGFKEHITEAFWLSPGQGAAFAPHIENFRTRRAMRDVRVDFTRAFRTLDGGETTLADHANGRRAVLLHFFSPWSRESADTLSDYSATAGALRDHGILPATIVGDGGAEAVAETRALLDSADAPPPGPWLVDPGTPSLERRLRVRSAPTMVLVGMDGRVLFHGHPSEEALWEEIRGLAPGFRRPGTSGR